MSFYYTWEQYSDVYDNFRGNMNFEKLNGFLKENFGDLWLEIKDQVPEKVVEVLEDLTGVKELIGTDTGLDKLLTKLAEIKMIKDF